MERASATQMAGRRIKNVKPRRLPIQSSTPAKQSMSFGGEGGSASIFGNTQQPENTFNTFNFSAQVPSITLPPAWPPAGANEEKIQAAQAQDSSGHRSDSTGEEAKRGNKGFRPESTPQEPSQTSMTSNIFSAPQSTPNPFSYKAPQGVPSTTVNLTPGNAQSATNPFAFNASPQKALNNPTTSFGTENSNKIEPADMRTQEENEKWHQNMLKIVPTNKPDLFKSPPHTLVTTKFNIDPNLPGNLAKGSTYIHSVPPNSEFLKNLYDGSQTMSPKYDPNATPAPRQLFGHLKGNNEQPASPAPASVPNSTDAPTGIVAHHNGGQAKSPKLPPNGTIPPQQLFGHLKENNGHSAAPAPASIPSSASAIPNIFTNANGGGAQNGGLFNRSTATTTPQQPLPQQSLFTNNIGNWAQSAAPAPAPASIPSTSAATGSNLFTNTNGGSTQNGGIFNFSAAPTAPQQSLFAGGIGKVAQSVAPAPASISSSTSAATVPNIFTNANNGSTQNNGLFKFNSSTAQTQNPAATPSAATPEPTSGGGLFGRISYVDGDPRNVATSEPTVSTPATAPTGSGSLFGRATTADGSAVDLPADEKSTYTSSINFDFSSGAQFTATPSATPLSPPKPKATPLFTQKPTLASTQTPSINFSSGAQFTAKPSATPLSPPKPKATSLFTQKPTLAATPLFQAKPAEQTTQPQVNLSANSNPFSTLNKPLNPSQMGLTRNLEAPATSQAGSSPSNPTSYGRAKAPGPTYPGMAAASSISDVEMQDFVPSQFTTKQRNQFYRAYRLRSLNIAMSKFLDSIPAQLDITEAMAYFTDRRREILGRAAVSGSKHRGDDNNDQGDDDDDQENRSPGKRNKTGVNGNSALSLFAPAIAPGQTLLFSNGDALMSLSPDQSSTQAPSEPSVMSKRKADDELTKDIFEAQERDIVKAQHSTAKGSYNQSNTSTLFQSIAENPTKTGATKKIKSLPSPTKASVDQPNPFGNVPISSPRSGARPTGRGTRGRAAGVRGLGRGYTPRSPTVGTPTSTPPNFGLLTNASNPITQFGQQAKAIEDERLQTTVENDYDSEGGNVEQAERLNFGKTKKPEFEVGKDFRFGADAATPTTSVERSSPGAFTSIVDGNISKNTSGTASPRSMFDEGTPQPVPVEENIFGHIQPS